MSSAIHNPTLDLFDNSKLNLDMSFNRKPEGRFACDIDPLCQDPFELPVPTPTFEDFEPTEHQLFAALREWKFPVRTDCARGLIWGPYKHCRGNSWSSELDVCTDPNHESLFIEPSNQQHYSCDRTFDIPVPQHYSEHVEDIFNQPIQEESEPIPQPLPQFEPQLPEQPPAVRLQRIIPILRSPIVIRIKPLSSISTTNSNTSSKRRRQSSRGDSFKSPIASPRILHFGAQPNAQKKQKFVQVAFSVETTNPSRIKLCPASRLKYTN